MTAGNVAISALRKVLGVEPGQSLKRAILEPAAVVLITFGSTTALAQPFYVPTGSMQPTLAIGDALLGSKFAYGYSRYSLPFALGPSSQSRLFGKMPKRGDVMVLRLPRDPSQTYVKR